MKVTPLAALAPFALVALAACAHSGSKRGDWRGPPTPPAACASDADCHGGTCAIELGAAQGACSAAPDAPSGEPRDPNAPPDVNVQPAPTDIKL